MYRHAKCQIKLKKMDLLAQFDVLENGEYFGEHMRKLFTHTRLFNPKVILASAGRPCMVPPKKMEGKVMRVSLSYKTIHKVI